MKRQFHIVVIREALLIGAACFALSACHSQRTTSAPAIVFSQVPAENSNARAPIIAGRVTGARPGQRIVLYARTDGRWNVQSHQGEPFSRIGEDGRWAASTQLGSDYAALLVEPGYRPAE